MEVKMNWKCLILLLCFSTAVLAVEDPPNCSLANGGQGNTSFGGVSFTLPQAHVGDTISVVATLGMIVDACKAINATGSIWISTGHLTNFFDNVTLDPVGFVGFCPTIGSPCEPGPYSFVITAPMVGASVTSPLLTVAGIPNRIRVIQNGVGTVKTTTDEQLADVHTSSALIVVNPCIEVSKTMSACMGEDVQFTGYVRNCGDITLTNVIVTDDRTPDLFEPDGDPLPSPLTITAGAMVNFKGSFTPFGSETATATNSVTVTGRDTTTIGGPSAFVTNSVTTIVQIANCQNTNCQCPFLIWDETTKRKQYAMLRP